MHNYDNIPTSALIALGVLILKRAQLESLPCTTREQAIAIKEGVRPAPSRRTPLIIRAKDSLCTVCRGLIVAGSLCDNLGRTHIACKEVTYA